MAKATGEEQEEIFAPRIKQPEESYPDGTLLLQLTISGRPTTKKTSQNIIYVKGRPRVVSSERFLKYERDCKKPCEDAWKKLGKLPMDYGVSIKVKVYLNTWVIGDHVGYLQSLGDILEKHGVLANDKFIHWTDGGEHWFGGIDKENPRVEISIYRYKHPYEDFRAQQEATEARKAAKLQANIK